MEEEGTSGMDGMGWHGMGESSISTHGRQDQHQTSASTRPAPSGQTYSTGFLGMYVLAHGHQQVHAPRVDPREILSVGVVDSS